VKQLVKGVVANLIFRSFYFYCKLPEIDFDFIFIAGKPCHFFYLPKDLILF
jgi:hypothetical protein